ncbi:MAG: hypothetical protein Q7R95_07315 [bacterium]|nr:hypothetical protein [bacterium]
MSNKKPLVIDLFQCADEQELIEIRLAENYETISQFCIVESCFDQCGNPKPYNFELNFERYKPWIDKITYYKIEDLSPLRYSFDWSNEVYVRNCLSNCLKKYSEEKNIKLESSTKLLFSDCDEIVNNQALIEALDLGRDLLSFTHLFNCYKLNYYAPARNWYGAILIDFDILYEHNFSFQELRKKKDHIYHFGNKNHPSWHFSGIGEDSFEINWNKWKTRIEPKEKIPEELKEQYREFFNKCVFEDKYFFYSDQITRRDEDLKLEILDKLLLPRYVRENDKFNHLLLSS